MIRYALRCHDGHGFEAWFRSSAAFDAQSEAGQVACAVCGGTRVEKAPMAPAVSGGRSAEPAPPLPAAPSPAQPPVALAAPASPLEAALRALRAKLEQSADYVGGEFAREARRIVGGEAADRPIWGEATPAEAKGLIEDGISIAPLPWMPRRDD